MYKSVKIIMDKGYLIQKQGNIYYFYTMPQKTDARMERISNRLLQTNLSKIADN